ncbi:unnamed protein product [Bursaphelenchus okinawaensis]|uniref:7TM_GPCR_Srx domain-containing protein n=1 Tax=Bursaphelenchus okinawaensis TaxID=465554 RepID=A0A811KMP7_9BILA|nr:unnamed protein product [Bursaphelenchus okinawaensis]CAG9105379.1 unnamed protein product [Bursaphelenchus okinawaensis]
MNIAPLSLYLTCLFCIISSQLLVKPTYKLMVLLGVFHISCLTTAGVIGGYFYLKGVVFCSYPSLVYVTGALDLASWCAGSATNLLIAINRCCFIYSDKLNRVFFTGNAIYVWILIILLYYVFVLMFVRPPLFNSYGMTYLINPDAGYFGKIRRAHTIVWADIHNFIDLVISVLVIIAFILIYKRKNQRKSSAFDKQMFIQVLLIHLFQFLTCACFNTLRFVRPSTVFNAGATIIYVISQGITPVIYLTFNQTIKLTLASKILKRGSAVKTSVNLISPLIHGLKLLPVQPALKSVAN